MNQSCEIIINGKEEECGYVGLESISNFNLMKCPTCNREKLRFKTYKNGICVIKCESCKSGFYVNKKIFTPVDNMGIFDPPVEDGLNTSQQ